MVRFGLTEVVRRTRRADRVSGRVRGGATRLQLVEQDAPGGAIGRFGASVRSRNGCSTNRHDRYEIVTVSANSATLSKPSSTRLLLENRAKVNSGQCQRYSE